MRPTSQVVHYRPNHDKVCVRTMKRVAGQLFDMESILCAALAEEKQP